MILTTNRLTAALLPALLWAAAVTANPSATPAERAGADVRQLQMVGEARLEVLFWSIYDSRLYTADGSYREGQRPLRLEIEYLIDIKAEKLAQRTLKEWRHMGRDHPRQAQWADAMQRLWPDIESGDKLALELDADNRATFYFNGERLGSIDDPDFGAQFVDIWLSPQSSRPELRLALLGRD